MITTKHLETIELLAASLMPDLHYHNMGHAMRVRSAAKKIAESEGIADTPVLEAAALLHDAGYVVGDSTNEERSAYLAGQILGKLGYSQIVPQAQKLILATRFPQQPEGLLGKVLCDADLASLGSVDYLAHCNSLIREFGIEPLAWYKQSLDFLRGHKYFTKSAERLYPHKAENIELLEKIIGGVGHVENMGYK